MATERHQPREWLRPILVWPQQNLLLPNGVACSAPPSPSPDRAAGAQGAGPVPLPWQPGRRAAARRPPRHLADLPLAGRRAAVAGLGQPPFRASQLSRHFFGRYTDRPEEMSDLPLAARDPLTAGPAAPAADRRARAGLRRRDHPQDAVAHVRRGAGRVGADALPGPGHDVRVVAGGLRDGLPVLRDRAGGPDPQPVHRRDRRPGGGGRPAARGGQVPGGPGRVSNVVFMGMGEPLANYASVLARGPPADRPGARGHGHLPALGHGLHGRPGPGHRPAGRRTSLGHPGRVPARPGRRAARHAGAGQPALEGGRGAGRRLGLRRGHRPPDLHRVRPDQGHQRPGLAGRPAGLAAGRAARPRQPDPAQPDARARSGPRRGPPRSASSSAAWRRTASRSRCGTPGAARSTAPAASWPPRRRPPAPPGSSSAPAGK